MTDAILVLQESVIGELRAVLKEVGEHLQHTEACAMVNGERCSCGLADLQNRIEQAQHRKTLLTKEAGC